MQISRMFGLVAVALLLVLVGPAEVGGQESTASISGTAYTFNTRDVIPGATIRAVEFPDRSTTTAADGSYILDFPQGASVTLYIEAEGHAGIHLQTFTLDDQHHGTAVVGANFQTPSEPVYAGLRALVASYTGQDPFEGGCVVVATVGVEELVGMPFDEFIQFAPHGVEGATALITPTVSEPIYFNSSVVPDVNQMATSNDGGVLWPNVPPGEYVLSASHPTATFTTVDVRCDEGWVVNANPVWGLHAIDPSAVTTTTTTEVTSTTDATSTSTSTSVVPTSIGVETTTSAADDPAVTTTVASSRDGVSDRGSGGGQGAQPAQGGDLPRTGADPRQLAWAAVVTLLGGSLLLALAHRQFRRS